MSLSEKQSGSSGSRVSSSVSVKSDHSKGDGTPNFSEKQTSSIKSVRSGSHVSSSVSVKSDRSKDFGLPNFREKKTSSTKSVISGSHVFSSMSEKSDQSHDPSPNLSGETPSSTKSVRSGSHVSSSLSAKSDCSKDYEPPNFREKNPSSTKSVRSGSHMSSSVSVKSDQSKDKPLNFSEKISPTKRVQHEKLDTKVQKCHFHKKFRENLHSIFQDLENKIITFLKYELEKFKKILKKENTQYFVRDTEDMCRIKEAALDLTLYFLREMKQDEAADTLEDKLVFMHLKSNLKKKYQCVFEGIAKQGDATLLNSIYTDLYITQGCTEQVNTEHEVRQIEVTSRRHESQEIQVECTNLFQPGKDKKIKTVLTKGVAGIGKSVSVQKFVLDWAEGRENQDISFIFPLPFREMNLKDKEKQSLMDLITLFFPETKGLNLAKRNMYKVLFILDGLDEFRLPLNFECNETWSDVSSPASLDVLLTNLIKGNLLPSALIWITTRPAAASKIPPDCIDRVTEIRGFNDAQKEEYFRKRFKDENQAKEIIDHVKKSKSLFIMCHIPVFCWISATVLKNILEMKTNNDQKNNQANNVSKTLQESNTEDTPKTLTQMYTHFLRFQILQSRRKYDGEYTPDISWDKDAILSLGKLAFQQLERNNVIFYESDLEACGIDVYKASVYSGMCTQIFKEERGIILGTMYCFVHLSIQEFIAALYAHLFLDIHKNSVFVHESTEQDNKNETVTDLLKTVVDKALESDNGHLDLFLRFLLGLSIQSNRLLLQGLLTQQDDNDQSKKEIVQYIKHKFEANLSPERSINLFYCLNELNDQTLVKEIQTHLSKGSLSSADLSPAQWSAMAFVLLTSKEELEEFELQKFKKSDECLIRLSAVIKNSKIALLNDCDLTDRSCSALATILGSDTSLKEMNMNNNNLQDSGVKLLCTGLENVKCELEILRLSDCSITEEGYKALASALRSNPSHLIELDLTGNDPGQSGVKELNDLLQDPNCQLKTLRFLSPDAEEACQHLTGVVGKNPLLLRELNLSGHELGDTRVNQIAALLLDKHCHLNTLQLHDCGLTEESCSALATVLRSNSSLKELDMSNNNLQDSGVKKLQNGLENTNCTLQKLRLSDCSITEDGYKALASALRSNPSHLIELDLTGNDPGQSGVKQLDDLLQDPNCQLKTLRFLGPAADEACQDVNRVLGENLLHLRELNLSEHKLGLSGLNKLAAVLQDKHCKLNTLILNNSDITEEDCRVLTAALNSNSSNLTELNLSETKLRNSGMKIFSTLFKNEQCRLKKLMFNCISITAEGCAALTSAFNSNPSNLIELDLSGNKLENSGVTEICTLLGNSQCTLQILRLLDCSITEEGYKALASALRSNPSHLIELDLTGNDPGQSGVEQLNELLQDPNCQLKTLRFLGPAADEACQYVTKVQGENPLLLRELNLSRHELGDTRVNQIAALLQDKHCKLNTLTLCGCSITENQCLILTLALKSNPSHLRELDLSGNKIENKGVKHICDLLIDFRCKMEKLRLRCCDVTDEGCSAVTSALKSNPSHLRELDLSENKLGDSGFENISNLLMSPQCKLEILALCKCSIREKQCVFLTSALKSNPSHLRELDLSGNVLKHTRVTKFYDILKDSRCKLERLRLRYCAIKAEDCLALTSALKSNPSHLRELALSGNELGQLGATNLSDLLMSPQCKLEKLDLCRCRITEKQCVILTSALKSNPSHLRELDLSENQLGDSGVENLGVLLSSSQCKLEKLHLCGCRITEKQCLILTSDLCSNPSHLRELDLSGNKIENKGVQILCDVLNHSHCKLERLSLNDCGLSDVACMAQSLAETKALLFLRELDLSNNKIGDSKQQLIDVLRDSNCKLCLEKEHLLSWRAGVNYIGSFGGWLTSWSKTQEEPVESTEQEKVTVS
ncbi:NLR family CARD domain-containing protein 3-like isoform X3 [Onychostoma macrolepis]|uniref:NLR family CARD domain-containing protein 3-like isoform X3 n=1 Tax=Onychostoma macrolepis TaxID=369639 RepID=UPI00272DBBBF|nr:NLR family CARD domain-containing protein 3-like isoform X3 [Onychostoma macrolepis]